MRKTWFKPAATADVWETTWQREFEATMGDKACRDRTMVRLESELLSQQIREQFEAGQTILEGGCGLGQWALFLKENGYHPIGIELSPWVVGRLKKTLPDLDIREGNILDLPIASESVDGYLSLGVVEHFENGPDKALKEANRILKPGGILILTFPYMNLIRTIVQPISAVNENRLKKDTQWQFYQYAYGAKEMNNYLSGCGFEVIRQIRFAPLPFLIRFAPFRFIFNYFYGKLRGKKLSLGQLSIDTNVTQVKSKVKKNKNLEQRLRALINVPVITAVFSHELMLVARKKR